LSPSPSHTTLRPGASRLDKFGSIPTLLGGGSGGDRDGTDKVVENENEEAKKAKDEENKEKEEEEEEWKEGYPT
jgi:hypothetical protein